MAPRSKNQRRNRNRKRRNNAGQQRDLQRTQNAQVVTSGGAGQRQDLFNRKNVSRSGSHPLDTTGSDYLRARIWAELYYKEWTARKIVDLPVQDMLRKKWTYKGLTEDQAKAVNNKLNAMGFQRSLRQALKMERLVGGAVIILGVAGMSDADAAQALDIESVGPGDLIFANVVPRTKVSDLKYDHNPLSPTFGKPREYTVWQYPVHKSRMMVFDGDPLTDNEVNDLGLINRSYDGFGVSVLASVWDDIMRSIGARQGAMQLIQRASVLMIRNASLKAMMSERSGTETLQELDNIADQMSMYQAAMIDGKGVELDQWSATFGSVPELLEKYLQIVSAASDIPATRFLGQAPGGLNATGESDLENYYNMIDDNRESRLRPQLEKLLPILLRSEVPEVDPNTVEIEFKPLWNPSETEISTIATNRATAIGAMIDRDVIDTNEARDALTKHDVLGVELKPRDDVMDVESDQDAIDIRGALDDLNNLG